MVINLISKLFTTIGRLNNAAPCTVSCLARVELRSPQQGKQLRYYPKARPVYWTSTKEALADSSRHYGLLLNPNSRQHVPSHCSAALSWCDTLSTQESRQEHKVPSTCQTALSAPASNPSAYGSKALTKSSMLH